MRATRSEFLYKRTIKLSILTPEPPVRYSAVAVMMQAQIVTTPILDTRIAQLEVKLETKFAELSARIERSKAELVRWVFLVMLGNVALNAVAAALLNAFQHGR
jgi:hypothetical protein